MLEIGRMINVMVMVSIHIVMEQNIQVIGKMIDKMDMVYSNIQMGQYIKVIFKIQ